jgi:hypothetical protein
MKRTPTTPELAGACQILYYASDAASTTGRAILFSTISHLTGVPIAQVARTWEATR